jgi:hypothetical protein
MAKGLFEVNCKAHGKVILSRKEVVSIQPLLDETGTRIEMFKGSIYKVNESYEAVAKIVGLRAAETEAA